MSTQDSRKGRMSDSHNLYDSRDLKKCFKCGKMSKHRADECLGENFRWNHNKSAYSTSQSNTRCEEPRRERDSVGQKCLSGKRGREDSDGEDNNIYDRLQKYNARANVSTMVNHDDHVYSHFTKQFPNSEKMYAMANKFYSSDEEEHRTHDGFNNTYAARKMGAESTEPITSRGELDFMSIGSSSPYSDGGDTSTHALESAGDATKPVLRLRGGCRMSDESSEEDNDDLISVHSSMPSASESLSSNDDDVSIVVIEDGLPDMVDDVSSYDGDDSHDGDYVCDEDIDNNDGLYCLDVRSSVHEPTLLTAYYDASGLCSDQVIKREAKLKELFQCGLSFYAFCLRWYHWLRETESTELAELERQVEATERSNMCQNDVAAPARPSKGF